MMGILEPPLAWALGELEIFDKSMVTGAEAFVTGAKRDSSFGAYACSVDCTFFTSKWCSFVAFRGNILGSRFVSSVIFVGVFSSSYFVYFYLYSSASMPLILPDKPEAILWLIPTFT
jgi:hypothetical protein